MAGIAEIGLSGLLAYRSALATTSQNIANMYNENYTRRDVVLTEQSAAGNPLGVSVSDVIRVTNSYVTKELQQSTANFNFNQVKSQSLNELGNFFSLDATNIAIGYEKLSNSLQSALENPSVLASRSVFLNQANSLVQQFQSISDELNRQVQNSNDNLRAAASEASALVKRVADINLQITRAGGTAAPDLLDQREGLLKELSKFTQVNVTEQPDGAVNVSLNNGSPLVVGSKYYSFSTQPNAENSELLDIIVTDGTITSNITNTITTGKMGGLLSYRDGTVKNTLNQIGVVAAGIIAQTNSQHRLGMDLQGNLGGNFYNDLNSATAMANRVLPNLNNTQNETMTVAITDVSQLTGSDYRLSFTAPNDYVLTRISDNTSVATGIVAAFPHTISADGFQISISAGTLPIPASERYLITPTRNTADEMTVAITNPANIALAAPIRTTPSTSNSGTGSISAGVVVDTTNASFTTTAQALTPPILIQFDNPPNTYSVYNNTVPGAPVLLQAGIPFTPGQANAVFPTPAPSNLDYGYRVDINGTPVAGDRFTVNYNTNGVGDNRNGLLLDDLKSSKILFNNTSTFANGFVQAIGTVASDGNAAKIQLEASTVLLEASQNKRDSLSGVNEDEEAAKLIRYQRGFEAMAKVFSVSDIMFSTLLGLTP
ncbi:MAG: flagellar hook-associated protein FlgK [Legionellales bacterium]|nr:flagellar hook-associated protein FlgK [Legionellales bacterium]